MPLEPVAIVGLACRFPSAPDAESFWNLLVRGRHALTEVPASRWNIEELYDPDPKTVGKTYSRWGGFLNGVDQFDAAFFGISDAEAERIDPQQRLLLEVAWEALENAGLAADRLAGTDTGVFVGISHSDYDRLIYSDLDRLNGYNGTGSYHSIAANRLSYVLDLRGPSLVVDTACSSSLVALQLACESLRSGETDLALVGGVQLNLGPEETVALSRARMLSTSGRCSPFDAQADGLVRGEGCGVLVVKLAERASQDGNHIQALVRGSAINQDGRSNGLTAPNGPAQEELLRRALRRAGVAPAQLDYVEGHGTGTLLGDAIELRSLAAVLSENRPTDRPCWVGSVKSNIGHLEAAAGVAGVIKVVLSMTNGRIPPQVNFERLNPMVSLRQSPLVIPTEAQDWPDTGSSRVAGISSFGFGGTNCHVVLEQPLPSRTEPPVPRTGRRQQALVLRARTDADLTALAMRYATFLADNGRDETLADICATANSGRAELPQRLVVTGQSATEMAHSLRAFGDGRSEANVVHGRARHGNRPKFAVVLANHGLDVPDAELELCAADARVRRVIHACRTALGSTSRAAASFALQCGVIELWRACNVEIDAIVACGLGECAAAFLSGTVDLDAAIGLALANRGAEATVLGGVAVEQRISRLLDDGYRLFAQIGPIPEGADLELTAVGERAEWLAGLQPGRSAWQQVLLTFGTLYARGASVSWSGLDGERATTTRVELPTYPFNRKRHWFERAVA
jgi:myxalamid-type polyketide synthase MxaB